MLSRFGALNQTLGSEWMNLAAEREGPEIGNNEIGARFEFLSASERRGSRAVPPGGLRRVQNMTECEGAGSGQHQ